MPPKIKVVLNKENNKTVSIRGKGRPSKEKIETFGKGGRHITEVNLDPKLLKRDPEDISKALLKFRPSNDKEEKQAYNLGALVEQQYLKQQIRDDLPYIVDLKIDGVSQYKILNNPRLGAKDSVARAFHTDYIVDSANDFSSRFNKKGKLSIEIRQLKNLQNIPIGTDRIQKKGVHYKKTAKVVPIDTSALEPNCFIDCIREGLNKRLENCKNGTNKNYAGLKRKLDKLHLEYHKTGVPFENIQKIVDEIGFGIRIKGFNGEILNEFKSTNSSLGNKWIEIMETRDNHVELARNYNDAEIKLVSQEEMDKIIEECFENKTLCFVRYDKHTQKIFLANDGINKYIVENKNNELIKEQLKSEYINQFETTFTTEQFKYYNSGIQVPYARLFKPGEEVYRLNETTQEWESTIEQDNLNEYDLKKAYTQYKKSPFYCGFPKKMTALYSFEPFSPTEKWCRNNHGVFDFSVKATNKVSDNTIKILNKFGLCSKDRLETINIRRTNIVMLMLLSWGFELEICRGMVALDSCEFEIPNELIAGKQYSKFVGKMAQKPYTMTNYQILPVDGINLDYMSLLLENKALGLEGDFSCDMGNFYYTTNIEVKKIKSLQHISGHIFDYTLSLLLEQLLQQDYENIIATKLDSFILDKKITIDSDIWDIKEPKIISSAGIPFIGEYQHIELSSFDFNLIKMTTEQWEKIKKHKKLLVLGQGGSGKTHKHLTSDSYVDLFTTAKQWTNVCDHTTKYKHWGYSLASFLGETLDKEKEGMGFYAHSNRRHAPSCIFIDELTMVCNRELKKLTTIFPDTLLIMAGDFNTKGQPYQCYINGETAYDKPVVINNDWAVDYCLVDYRAKNCQQLIDLKLKLREAIDKDETGLDLIKELPTISKEDLTSLDPENTNIICSKNETIDYLSEKLNWNTGKIIKHNKQDILSAQLGKGGLLNGMIVKNVSGIPSSKVSQQSAFTIHSFQGKTIPEGEKLVFVVDKIFQNQLVYTAISRAVSIQQILVCYL